MAKVRGRLVQNDDVDGPAQQMLEVRSEAKPGAIETWLRGFAKENRDIDVARCAGIAATMASEDVDRDDVRGCLREEALELAANLLRVHHAIVLQALPHSGALDIVEFGIPASQLGCLSVAAIRSRAPSGKLRRITSSLSPIEGPAAWYRTGMAGSGAPLEPGAG